MTSIKGKKIAVLGLSFKENSGDIRESVSISLIKLLLKNGAKVVVHDPKAIENVKKIFGNKINYTSNIFNTLYNSECAVIMTTVGRV